MKRCYLLIIVVFSFIHSQSIFGQQGVADSLYKEYTKSKIDTVKINLLNNIFKAYSQFDISKGVAFSREALELANRINYQKGICVSHTQIGDYYYEQVNYSESIKHYLEASVVGEKIKFYSQLSALYNRIGIIYSNQSKDELSLKYFFKVAEIAEKQDNPKRLAIAYNNIGISYKDLGRYSEAKKYYVKALAEFEKSDFKLGIASVNNGLGIISHLLKDDVAALDYYDKAMLNFRLINDTLSEYGIFTNIGEVYNDKKEYTKALDCYLKSLRAAEEYKNDRFRLDSYDGLSEVYANLKNYERAFYFIKRHLALKDSIEDKDGMLEVQALEKRLENEKKEKEIEVLKQREEIQALKVQSQSEKLNQSKIIIYAVAGVLLLALVMSFFILKSNKQIKKTNLELAEKKKEIQDSINYAQKIQESMLPDVSILAKHFPKGGFGFFQPKDVVSGDFYWFNELNDIVYFAAADCTGHGVPGAFMSMIGIDKLNSFIDKKVEHLPQILSLLNISIKRALKQTKDSKSSRDGMDIALCSYDNKSKILNYSGANRPIWILRKNEMIEFKPTKASIAGHVEDYQEYVAHQIQLEEDDTIFLFSDGFADQFGGPDKKKYKTKLLKQTLIDIQHLNMSDQELKLTKIFNDWKGNLEQVDDVLVLGFKI